MGLNIRQRVVMDLEPKPWIRRTAFWWQTIDFLVRGEIVETFSELCIWSTRTSGMMFLVFIHIQYDFSIDLTLVFDGFATV